MGLDNDLQNTVHDIVEYVQLENNNLLLKLRNRWSEKSFTYLLELLKDMLSKGNELLDHTNEAKKTLCLMGMDYKKIHACPNDYTLY